ncbi:MAG TPA: DNA polymerase III subunit [Firmicutes bacterium]|nr:DNA polymerase III subunit [Bacillota bacterium]
MGSAKAPPRRLIDRVLGQDRVKAIIGADLRAGRLTHALLLSGPAGVGKQVVARAVAQALLCSTSHPSGWGCGGCRDCQEVEAGTHPDCHWLEAAAGQRLGIDELRGWVQSVVALRPVRGGSRVGVLVGADRATEAGQNMLLKSLEEPPASTTWILVTESPAGLLPTIRSRCQHVTLGVLPVHEVAEWLKAQGVKAEVAATAARLSGGRPGVAWDLSQPEAAARRNLVVDWVLALREATATELFRQAEEWAEAPDLPARLEILALCLRDLTVLTGPRDVVAGEDEFQAGALLVPELVQRQSGMGGARRGRIRDGRPRDPAAARAFLALAEQADGLARRAGQLGSPRLSLDALFLDLRSAWHKCAGSSSG